MVSLYRNQSVYLQDKSMDWFLYDIYITHKLGNIGTGSFESRY